MKRIDRIALLKQHITKGELIQAELTYLGAYLVIALGCLPDMNIWLYLITCLFLFIGLGAIRDHLLLWVNEKRCKAAEANAVEPESSSDEDSSDSDSNNSEGD